jgi:hypothetical protein
MQVSPLLDCIYWMAHRRSSCPIYEPLHPPETQQLLRAGDDEVILLEVVRGMGEALVGNHPGAALAATARKLLLPAAAEAPPAAAQLPAGCVR